MGPEAARLEVIILHPFLDSRDALRHSWGTVTGSCLSFRHSKEHPCVYAGREHRDHVRCTHPKVLQHAEPGQSCDVAPREGWKSRTVDTGKVFILQ